MARWIFSEVRSPAARAAEPALWRWELRHDDGRIVQQSAGGFRDFHLCADDASRHGYYAGHYDVIVQRAEEEGLVLPM
jgi:hypothetical protein